MYDVYITFKNVVNSYLPKGWTHYKKEYVYKKYIKRINSFTHLMGYLSKIRERDDVVEVSYVNLKTGERREWLI